jgi:hypothetical protein
VKIKCVLWFPLRRVSVEFLILRIIRWDIIIKVHIGPDVQCLLFLSDFNENWLFSTNVLKTHKIPNFTKVLPGGTQLFYADKIYGQADIYAYMLNLIIAFRSLTKVPKKRSCGAGRVQRQSFVDTVMRLQLSKKGGNFLTNRATVSVSIRIFLVCT